MLEEILEHLNEHPRLLLSAPPGAGKTTRVPASLMQQGLRVLVCQPRRLAARWAAGFLARQLGSRVGYHVRFDRSLAQDTRLTFVTNGILLRYLQSDPQLSEFDAVVLDEFHERHLDGDLALAFLLRLQERRPGLRLLVMSATLQVGPLEEHLKCRCIESPGRSFVVEVEHVGGDPLEPIEQQVARAYRPHQGHTLVFLPGMAEIRRCQQLMPEGLALHGSLSPAEQDLALARSATPKLIFSTNVAESSVTIEGVTSVIDSGLARVARESVWSGIKRLTVERVSRASAVQRAGRAGRTAPGRCLRLYSLDDFLARDEFEAPEIERLGLARLILDLLSLGVDDPAGLPWLTPPEPERLEAGWTLLARLGAVAGRELTQLGAEMARFPVAVRQARLVLCAHRVGASKEGCRLAAALEESNFNSSDPLELAAPDPRLVQQLRQALPSKENNQGQRSVLRKALLSAYPDRLGRVAGDRVVLAEGGWAGYQGPLDSGTLALVLEVDERKARQPRALVVSPLEEEWVWEFYLEQLREEEVLEWDDKAGRVYALDRVCLGQLVLEEKKRWAAPGPETAKVLAPRVKQPEALRSFLRRARWLAEVSDFPEPPTATEVVEQACQTSVSLSEVSEPALLALAKSHYSYSQQQELDRQLPLRISLPRRRKGAPVEYPDEGKPWVSSRLADFLGVAKTPQLAQGRVPLLFHLLAPNGRAVQVTEDLAGFWERTYPRVRAELRGRYPKHPWPEDPTRE